MTKYQIQKIKTHDELQIAMLSRRKNRKPWLPKSSWREWA